MATAEYVCSLSEKSVKKAKKELHEDPKQRIGAVETFRTWIQQQKHIRCETDTLFLLRFLRAAKFSQLKARELLENYLRSFMSNPEWTQNIDLGSPGIQAFIKQGYFALSGEDTDGKTVCILKMGNFDPTSKEFTKDEMMKSLVGMFYSGFFNEENQVNGNIYFVDAAGYSIKHSTYFNIDDMKRNTKMWQNAFPVRYKGFHYYNMSSVFEGILTLIKPIMNKKWTERLKIHSSMESVYKYIERSKLPMEYLPDDYKGDSVGSHQQLIDNQLKSASEPAAIALAQRLSDPKLFWIDMKQKDTDVPQNSFRKLNID